MNNKKSNKPETGKEKSGLGKITRRTFTIGSVAAIGAGSFAEGGPDTPPPFKLEATDTAYQLMVDRHILESDLIQVIQYAEKTGEKLYQKDSDRFLAKLKLNTVYFYAEYSPIEEGYLIHNAYSHRFTLEGTM